MSENIHEGHRNRLKEEVLSADITSPKSPEKLLEMLLFYGVPRQDTAPIAKALLARFGDFSGVLDAEIEDLVSVKGVTRNAAALIKLMRPVGRTYVLSKFKQKDTLKNHDEIGNFIATRYYAIENECFSILCLNRLGKVLSFEMLSDGSTELVSFSVRAFLKKILKTDATAVVIAHNHPGGIALPSKEDIELTLKLKEALDMVSINLIDHVIVGDGDYTSMAQTQNFEYIFKPE